MTRKACCLLAFLVALPASAAERIAVNQPRDSHGLHFTTPVTVWDEALPLGNGIMGALVWGDGKPIKISLDRSDLWDLRLVPEFSTPEYKFRIMREWHLQGRTEDLIRLYEAPYNRPAPTRIPAGRIELTLGSNPALIDSSLSLGGCNREHAVQGGHSSCGPWSMRWSRSECCLCSPESRYRSVSSPRPSQARSMSRRAAALAQGTSHSSDTPRRRRVRVRVGRPFCSKGAEGFRFAVCVCWKSSGESWTAAWSVASSYEGADPLALARKRAESALAKGYDGMAASHRAWWSNFWQKSSVTLPNAVLERQWYLETYKFGAAARRGTPPISLQAIWTADDGKLPPWKGDYHHDLNTQLSYWPCYSGNHLDEGLGYLEYLWNTRDAGVAWTRRFFEMPGLNVPMTADLNGNQIGGWRQYTHSATTAAWLAQHFYLHWKYSADREFLAQRAYPYVRDAAVFLETFTAERGPEGLPHFSPQLFAGDQRQPPRCVVHIANQL